MRSIICAAVVAALLVGCAGGTPAVPGANGSFEPIQGASLLVRGQRDMTPAGGAEAAKQLAAADGAFALDLYRHVAAGTDGNIVIGPHSISAVMTMVYAGARGETEADLRRVLHLDAVPNVPAAANALDLALRAQSSAAVDLRLANQAFVRPGFPLLDAYVEALTRDFGAPIAELDFGDAEGARRTINDWAASRTKGRIDELFPPESISPNTVLVLANAVSLIGQWKYRFDPSLTSVAKFRLPDGTDVDVPMMHFDYSLPLAQGADFEAVELPYGDSSLSMVLILPHDMTAFEASLDAARLETLLASINEQGIHLLLPRFTVESATDMDSALRAMGLARLYDNADLSGIAEGGGLHVDTVRHSAFIEVDEEGTEAHAASGGAIAISHGPTIEFNRPFLFVILDRTTGAILFLGRVNDPRN